MKRKISIFLLIIILTLSCQRKSFKGDEGEGIIEYDITYIENNLQKVPKNILPNKMVFYYTPRYVMNAIEGYGGVIKIKSISDLKKDTVTTIFKFFNHKYFYTSRPKETPCCFEILEKPEIKLSDDTIRIAGFLCHKANVFFPSTKESHAIFYTKEIKSGFVNKNTAYEDIPGILMQFQMEMGNLTLLFKAVNIDLCEVDKDIFKISDGYKKIPRVQMVKIINQLLE